MRRLANVETKYTSSEAEIETRTRRLPIGAEVEPGGGVHFRVWAPGRRVQVMIEGKVAVELTPEENGYHSGSLADARAGALYHYCLDGEGSYPDPASRFQPRGVHGASQVIDPSSFAWTDGDWAGVELSGQVLYEMHLGTFSKEGTWAGAANCLPRLAELGVTTIEVMPVGEFAGRFGWGYDGVALFAPYHLYGTPDDARRFVNRAHSLGLAVILDVVYNHFGPDGCYQTAFSNHYVHAERAGDWGDSLNFDGPGSGPTREYFLSNAAYWIDEFHFDGLRLDAVQAIHDESADHIVKAIVRRAREAARGRKLLIFAENEPQTVRLIRPESEGGFALDGVWNDDFHHAAWVALTGHAEAYYGDYQGTPQELISALKWGFLFQGQIVKWQQKRRGPCTFGIPASRFLIYLENHDQVANSARGLRLRCQTSPGRYRALTAVCLLAPQTPLLFQGQELGSTQPFLYFSDHHDELAKLVREGRREELSGFRSTTLPELRQLLPDPASEDAFLASKLQEPDDYRSIPEFRLIRDLLAIRREDPVIRRQDAERVHGAVIGEEAFAVRYFGDLPDCRLLLVNLGRDLYPTANTEPLLAPPPDMGWSIAWFSEHPHYDGSGIPPLEEDQPWRLPGHTAVLLRPVPSPGRTEAPPPGSSLCEDYDVHPGIRTRRGG